MALIYHITYRSQWNFAKLRDQYQTDSLATQGFIHCSDKKQILEVANSQFKGEKDLVLLVIDTTLLRSNFHYEALGTSSHFPHIYGPLNLDAIIQVLTFRQDSSGSFNLPANLK